MKSEFAQPVSFPVASIATPLNVQNLNAQFEFDFRTQHAFENQRLIQNAYSSHHEWSGPSPTTSAIPYPTAGLASMIPLSGPSFHVRRGSVASLSAVDSFPLPSSPILHDHFVGISPVCPELAPPAAPSQIAGHALPHQDNSGSLGASLAPRKEPRTGERKCSAPANQLISSAATPYHECSRSSSANLTASEPARMVPGPSSHMRHSSVASPHTVRSLSSTCSSGPQSDDLDGSDGIVSVFPGSASDGAPSLLEGHDLSQQLEGTSSADPEAPQSRRRNGKRQRKDDPLDPFATERLRIRRAKRRQLPRGAL
jgi:hypothetical protein